MRSQLAAATALHPLLTLHLTAFAQAWGTGQRASPFLGHALWLVAQALVFMGAMVTMTVGCPFFLFC